MAGFNEYYKSNRRKNPLRWPDIDVVRLISKSLPPDGGNVLDLGCGEGRNLRFLLDCGYQPLCIDASEEALRLVHELYGLPADRLIQSDAITALEKIGSSTFDLILCWGLSHYVDNTKNLLGNIRRILKDSGSLVMSFSADDDQRPRAAEIMKLFSYTDVHIAITESNFDIQDFGKMTMIDYTKDIVASYFWVRASPKA